MKASREAAPWPAQMRATASAKAGLIGRVVDARDVRPREVAVVRGLAQIEQALGARALDQCGLLSSCWSAVAALVQHRSSQIVQMLPAEFFDRIATVGCVSINVDFCAIRMSRQVFNTLTRFGSPPGWPCRHYVAPSLPNLTEEGFAGGHR